MNNLDAIALIALKQTKGIGNVRINTILYNYHPHALFNYSKSKLRQVLQINNPYIIDEFRRPKNRNIAEIEYRKIIDKKINFIDIKNESYPNKLKNIYDPPPFILTKGSTHGQKPIFISIVGTRKPNHEAASIVEELLQGIKHLNPIIVSGLAYGVDTLAHKFSLENNLSTIGVLGSGFDHFYPKSNIDLSKKMIAQGGAIVSEHFLSECPNRENFPKRNRIVAGMSDCTIVIQSAVKGGSLLTADLASGYGREVFAFPGSIKDPIYRGTHKMIKEHKAGLIEGPEDLITQMNWGDIPMQGIKQMMIFDDLSNEESKIYKKVVEFGKVHIDQLAMSLQMNPFALNAFLLSMELRNIIKVLPGRHFTI